MRLTPRAIAVQGVGFKPLCLALQGICVLFSRAPSGGGYAARPVYGKRPAQALTYRPATLTTHRTKS